MTPRERLHASSLRRARACPRRPPALAVAQQCPPYLLVRAHSSSLMCLSLMCLPTWLREVDVAPGGRSQALVLVGLQCETLVLSAPPVLTLARTATVKTLAARRACLKTPAANKLRAASPEKASPPAVAVSRAHTDQTSPLSHHKRLEPELSPPFCPLARRAQNE